MKFIKKHWILLALLLLFLYAASKGYQAACQVMSILMALWILFKNFLNPFFVAMCVIMLAFSFISSLWSWLTNLLGGGSGSSSSPAANDQGASYSTPTNGVPLQITVPGDAYSPNLNTL